MPRRSIAAAAGPIAIVVAIAIWLAYGYLILQPGETIVRSVDLPYLLAFVAGGVLVDLVVAVRAGSLRAGGRDVAWLCLRAIMAAGGLLFVALPLYVIAALLVARGASPQPVADPHLPHDFRAVAGGWYRLLTPIWWSQNLLGASQIGARRCAACGQPQDAPIHAPEDEADERWPLDADASPQNSGHATRAE